MFCQAVLKGLMMLKEILAIIGRIIVTCVRHLGPNQAVRIAQLMVDEPHPYIVGFGMGGDESQYVASDFTPAFQIAIDAGYPCTVHAGEVCGSRKCMGCN